MITYHSFQDCVTRLQNNLSILKREGLVCSLQFFYDDMMEEEGVLKNLEYGRKLFNVMWRENMKMLTGLLLPSSKVRKNLVS